MIKQQWDLRWGDDWGRMRWHCSQTYLQCVCTVYNAQHIYSTGYAVSIFYYNMQFSKGTGGMFPLSCSKQYPKEHFVSNILHLIPSKEVLSITCTSWKLFCFLLNDKIYVEQFFLLE